MNEISTNILVCRIENSSNRQLPLRHKEFHLLSYVLKLFALCKFVYISLTYVHTPSMYV